MTSKLTREWLQEAISDMQTRRDNGSISWDDERENVLQALELALAAMDSEPVAWRWRRGPDTRWHLASRGDLAGEVEPLYRHAQPVPVGSEFIPKNLDRALGVLGMALPESKEEFNLQSERWIQRLIDRVIRYADEFKEQPALATQQEPIAWLNDAYLARGVVDGEAGSEDAGPGYIPVYREASPVVQDTRAITQYFDTIALETARGIMCDVNRRGDFLGGDTQLLSRIQCRIDNACRAAMLQAGNSPVIPDGWIPVSERMPEVGVKVLCFPVKDEPIHATFNGQLWLQDVSWSGSEEPIDNVIPVSVTHWMPLPAAPQEMK